MEAATNRVNIMMEILADMERVFDRARVDRVKYCTLFELGECAFIPNYVHSHPTIQPIIYVPLPEAPKTGPKEGSQEGLEGCRNRDSS